MERVTGGEQGMSDVPYPDLAWMDALPFVGSCASASSTTCWPW